MQNFARSGAEGVKQSMQSFLGRLREDIRLSTLLTWKKFWIVFIYSCVFFPILISIKPLAPVALLLTFPFLPFAYMGGWLAVWLFKAQAAYLPGACLTIFMQAYVILFFSNKLAIHIRRKRQEKAFRPKR
jgi:hypothetical protein